MGRRGPKPRRILTSHQVQVLQLVAEGMTNPEIAERLGQPKHWVGDRLKTAYRILGARSRAQAVMAAVASGILAHPTRGGQPGVIAHGEEGRSS